jgi:hypothetical protein
MKEIKCSVNWAVGWIAYRHAELSKIQPGFNLYRAVDYDKAIKNQNELRLFGEKILKGWM